jgi:ATP adenylyltransferase
MPSQWIAASPPIHTPKLPEELRSTKSREFTRSSSWRNAEGRVRGRLAMGGAIVISCGWIMEKSHAFRSKHAVEHYSASQHLWDTPIFESESFVSVPSVGALIEGWLLVVPKMPSPCLAHLSSSAFSELESFLAEIVPIVESSYGPITIFEHGSTVTTSPIGCGVDHAHLHLVPAKCDLQAGAQRMASNIRWSGISSFKALRDQAHDGYWFVQQPYGSGNCNVGICTDSAPPSQLFRKVIATNLGRPEAFDWKTGLGETRIAATVGRLSQYLVSV